MCRSLAAKRASGLSGASQGVVDLGGRAVPFTVRRSDRARNLRLQVGAEKGLEVVVPRQFALRDLEDLLREKQNWILGKLDHFARTSENLRLSLQQGGRRVLYRGREYEVQIKAEPGAARRVEVEEGTLLVVVPRGAEADAEVVLERWFRSMARLLIHQRIRVVNQKLGLAYNRVFIKGQKTRWGSCSQQRNLNFNWRLVMAPLPVLDYVVAHELLHLIELNHSKKFWALVAEACPDFKVHRAWLRKNGQLLIL